MMKRWMLASAMLMPSMMASAMMASGTYQVIAPDQHSVISIQFEPNSYVMRLVNSRSPRVVLLPVQEQAQPVAVGNCSGSGRSFGFNGVCYLANAMTGVISNQAVVLNLAVDNANTSQPSLHGTLAVSPAAGDFSIKNYHLSNSLLRQQV